MPARPPTLDTRKLKDILAQLRALAEAELPDWAPPPEGDAGTMLHRVFARLLELALERLNRAPEKNLRAFLDTAGVSLLPPSPAEAPLAFALLPGGPPTLVPKGTQAGTQPSGQQPAVIFETEHDLTVIPARLTQAFTMDPTWDRYTDQTTAVTGQSATSFTPFVGTKRIRHVLYLGDDALLSFSRTVKAVLSLNWRSGLRPDQVLEFFRQLSYQYRTQESVKTVSGPQVSLSDGLAQVDLSLPDPIDLEVIEGVGLMQGVQSRWLRAALTTPFPDALAAQDLSVNTVRLKVVAEELGPDFTFSNAAPLDVTKDFLPFGEVSKVGDTFYIASQDAFSKPKSKAKLSFDLKSTDPPELIWEYWGGSRPVQLAKSNVKDGTDSFTQSGKISLLVPTSAPATGDVSLRVRLGGGKYRGFPSVTKFDLIVSTTLKADVKAGDPSIELDYPSFAAEGQVLVVDKDEVVVVAAVSETDPNKITVKKAIRRKHDATKKVEVPEFRVPQPVATLKQGVKGDEDETRGDRKGDIQLVAGVRGSISPSDILKVVDGDSTEFVVVEKLHQATDLEGASLFNVSIKDPLLFNHAANVPLAVVTDKLNFFGFANGDWVDFTNVKPGNPFSPFGENPGPADVFLFGTLPGLLEFRTAGLIGNGLPLDTMHIAAATTTFGGGAVLGNISFIGLPFLRAIFPNPGIRINVDVTVQMTLPDVGLKWEFLGANGWETFIPTVDDTDKLRGEGTRQIVFSSNPCVLAEVNGKKNYWIRVRIVSGSYGLPVDYVPVDPADPSKGFKVKPGTGNLNPPVITKLTLSYEAERIPTSIVTQNGFLYTEHAKSSGGFAPFISVRDLPQPYADPEPVFYLGFDAAFPEQPVKLYIDAVPRAFAGSVIKETNVAPTLLSELPRLHWEYFNGAAWRSLTILDGTNNLTESGALEFLTPTDIQPLAVFDLAPRYWVRARSSKNDPFDTQQLDGVFLNTVQALQAVTVQSETLGSSNGQAGQTFRFARAPVLPGQQVTVREPEIPSDKERAAIEEEEGKDAVQQRTNPVTREMETWVRWHEVTNFLASEPHRRHYTLDRSSGLLTFGAFGPPIGTNNIAATYRAGGGPAGNLAKAAVTQVKSSLRGVSGVSNPVEADGGADFEAAASAAERGPHTLRHRDRAVAAADLEWLARQADGTRVARAKCLPNVNRELLFEPGWVTLLIVPQGKEAKLSPSSELTREVENYLQPRAFVGLAQQTPARVNVIGPGYIQVRAVTEIVPKDIDESQRVKQRALDALAAFFQPLTGGPTGAGWEFGRHVYASKVCQRLEGILGVDYVKDLKLRANRAQHRLKFATDGDGYLPEGSLVGTSDLKKMALVAESADRRAGRVAVKGFKEGDRITKALDLTHPKHNGTKDVEGVLSQVITVDGFDNDGFGFPRGSVVMTFDGRQRTRLATGIPPGGHEQIIVENDDFAFDLQPSDTLTVLYPFPMTVASIIMEAITLTVTSVSSTAIGVAPFNSGSTGLPRGSFITSSEGSRRTRLAQAIPPDQTGIMSITTQDPLFGASLKPGDSLMIQLPSQLLGIQPYEAEFTFAKGIVISTLDNRVRLPLLTELPTNQTVAFIRLQDFVSNETVTIFRRDSGSELASLTIESLEPIDDIVFFDDNFLPYSGAHQVTMLGE